MPRVLLLLETSGNQAFIFSTNKLRENVGASRLTAAACDDWVRAALGGRLRDHEILATSGKAYLRFDTEAEAKQLIQAVTLRALKEAPGLDLAGVFLPYDEGKLHTAIPRAHVLLASRKGTTPGPACRFLRLPVADECRSSGLPAAGLAREGKDRVPRSAVSAAKYAAADDGIRHMRRAAHENGGHDIVHTLNDLDTLEGVNWLGVVHADGNGLGQVFLRFHEFAGTTGDDDYAERLRAFSKAVDAAGRKAFGEALGRLRDRIDYACEQNPERPRPEFLPVAPILLGGDDLTVVMDGEHAVRFATDYLTAFENATADEHVIPPVMKPAWKAVFGQDTDGRVTACAGVAVMKPHFPFSAAYHLAEELLKSAKQNKPASGLDFHVLYDVSGPDLTRIRTAMTAADGTLLTARPYWVTDDPTDRRGTATLGAAVAAVRARTADGRPVLSNGLLHHLRAALFRGRAVADHEFNLVRHRYEQGFDALFGEGNRSMFFTDDGGATHRTHLLDALDLAGFWPEDRP